MADVEFHDLEMPFSEFKELVEYWRDSYDWPKQEEQKSSARTKRDLVLEKTKARILYSTSCNRLGVLTWRVKSLVLTFLYTYYQRKS